MKTIESSTTPALRTAHQDTFAADHLPPPAQWPDLVFLTPDLQALAGRTTLNCVAELLDGAVARGWGDRPCLHGEAHTWSYSQLQQKVDRIAHVLVTDLGLAPGNRVLLRAPNTPMAAACWLAVVKAGGIAVATMPLLREKELRVIIDKARISHALCEASLSAALTQAAAGSTLQRVALFGAAEPTGDALESLMAHYGKPFEAVPTAPTDTAMMAFTSGTTGVPKATMHFHRDVIAACLCWPDHILKPTPEDVFIGSPPLAFTFGLGGLLLFPLHAGASTVLLPQASPPMLLQGILRHRATIVFTSPTSYRAMAALTAQGGPPLRGSTLRECVSAGEALPAATRTLWHQATGLEMLDGIGSTEMLHIFISAPAAESVAGATGRAVPGYEAKVVDDSGGEVPDGTVGRLAVRGPTGCRYLDDARQLNYVQHGWNLTGDAYRRDAQGYFHYVSRTDDMIVSSGYNIGAPEVEDALLSHPAVAECGVIGVADEERGQIVKAYVVLRAGHAGDDAMAAALQDHVKATIAPYKYPRAVRFLDALPRTETGKLQRFRLRDIF